MGFLSQKLLSFLSRKSLLMQHTHCRKSPIRYLTLLALTPPYTKMKTDFSLDLKKTRRKVFFTLTSTFTLLPSCESKKSHLIELLTTNQISITPQQFWDAGFEYHEGQRAAGGYLIAHVFKKDTTSSFCVSFHIFQV